MASNRKTIRQAQCMEKGILSQFRKTRIIQIQTSIHFQKKPPDATATLLNDLTILVHDSVNKDVMKKGQEPSDMYQNSDNSDLNSDTESISKSIISYKKSGKF